MRISKIVSPLKGTLTPTDFYFVIDISGSMSYELENLRRQLQNAISTNLRQEDTLTILYYSGINQCGYVLNKFKMVDAGSLSLASTAINRYLQPIGLTSFVEPLMEVKNFDSRNPYFVFMTDGCENCGGRAQSVELVKAMKGRSIHFIEYGPYADHDFLVNLSELCNGTVSYAGDFENFKAKMVNHLSSCSVSYHVVQMDCDFIVGLVGGEVLILRPDNGLFSVPIGHDFYAVYHSEPWDLVDPESACLAMYALALKGKSNSVWGLIAKTGSIKLAKLYNKAIGKAALNRFLEEVKYCSINVHEMESEGYGTNLAPKDDEFCLLDLLDILAATSTQFIPSHKSFNYKRTGVKREMAAPKAFEDAIDKLDLAKAAKEVTHLNLGMHEVTGFDRLEYNTERANISIKVKYPGTVDLSAHPANKFSLRVFDTFTYRQYILVKDGMVHLSKLPVVSTTNFNYLPIPIEVDGFTQILDISDLPVTNKLRQKEASAQQICEVYAKRLIEQAKVKVFNATNQASKSPGFIEQYGQEITDFLKSVGITEGGYNPSTVKGDVSDLYYAPLLEVKVASFSSLPTLKAATDKLPEKRTPSEKLIWWAYENQDVNCQKTKAKLDRQLGEMVFTTLISRTVLPDAEYKFDNPSGEQFVCRIQEREVEVEI